MLHTLEKGEYPKGHRYWSNATGDLNAALEDLPVQLRRVLDELWSDGYGVECYLVEWNGRYCVQLSAMYDRDYAEDLGMGYPELVELARGRAKELGAERPNIHVVFAEDVDQWKANDPFTESWRSCAGGGLRLARRSGGKASSNTETYISRDGEGRAYTQARASGWVPSSL